MGLSSSRVAAQSAAKGPISPMDKLPGGLTAYACYDEEDPDIPEDLNVYLQGRPVSLDTLTAGRRVILMGIPGAFTPNCHRSHLPQYLAHAADFRAAGVDEIICLCTNDAWCMRAWARTLGSDGKVRLLSDPRAEVARALGVAMDASGAVGRTVYRRFCALLEDGIVKLVYVEAGNGLGVSCTAAVPLLSEVRSRKYQRVLGSVWTRPGEPEGPAQLPPPDQVGAAQL